MVDLNEGYCGWVVHKAFTDTTYNSASTTRKLSIYVYISLISRDMKQGFLVRIYNQGCRGQRTEDKGQRTEDRWWIPGVIPPSAPSQ